MDLNYEFMAETFRLLFTGVPVTLKLTVVSLLVSAPFAFFMALARIRRTPVAHRLVAVYTSLVRGVPVIVQILLIYSLLPSMLNKIFKAAGIRYNIFDLDTIWYAYAIFIFSTCAVLSEVFRSALSSVSQGQLEAGLSVGMSVPRVYLRVIIPQALVIALPSLCNVTVSLIKNTSLAFMMAVRDITAVGKIAASYGYNYVEAYIDVFFVYIIICSAAQLAFAWAEKHLSRFRRQTAGKKELAA